MDRGPRACTDAERRAALWLAAELRAAGRAPVWSHCGCARAGRVARAMRLAGVVGSVLLVACPSPAWPLWAWRSLSRSGPGRAPAPPPCARATQNVVAPAPAPRTATLVVLAAVDRPRRAGSTACPRLCRGCTASLLLTTGFVAARARRRRGPALGAPAARPYRRPPARAGVAARRRVRAPGAQRRGGHAHRGRARRTVPWAELVLAGAGEGSGCAPACARIGARPRTSCCCGSSPAPRRPGARPTRRWPPSRRTPGPRVGAAGRCPPEPALRSRSAVQTARSATSRARSSSGWSPTPRRPGRRRSRAPPGWPASRGWRPSRPACPSGSA